MISTTSNVLEFFSNIANDPALLANGYALITKYLKESQENRRDTLLNLFDPKVPVFSLVVNVYPIEIFGGNEVDNNEKDSTI